MRELSGSTSGRTLSVCGEIGVRMIALMSGATTGPPAESEYAVDPVGVATTTPSPLYAARCSPLTPTSSESIRETRP